MTTPPENTELKIEYVRSKKDRGTIIATLPGGGAVVDKVNILDAKARERFADRVCDGRPGIDRAEVLAKLDELAAEQAVAEAESGGDEEGSKRSGLANVLDDADGAELFHNADKDAFATLPVGDHMETWRVPSKGFRKWLSFRYYEATGEVAGSQELHDAMNTYAGRAEYDGQERPVAIRIADHEGAVWLDLCDEEWNAVRIDKNGWAIVPSRTVPVRFIRRPGMETLPVPVSGGSVNELRPLVNFNDEQFTLAIGWLVGAFRPRGPYGVLSVAGEQGSAKSTASKLLRRLIDPNRADLRRPPKDERDVFIAGSNSWISSYNNISGLKPQISDALCALATDGGFGTRMLYENDEEAIFSTRRPVILNGIDEPATRSDLVDRAVGLTLTRIPEDKILDEDEVMARFEAVRPRVLGAILTAVSAALRNKSSVKLSRKPRMADLATWVTAAEPGLDWRKEQFLDAYMGNRAEAHYDVIDGSPIGPPLMAMIDAGPVEGTATEILATLNHRLGLAKPPDEWPGNGKALGSMLRRLAPNLRAVGVRVQLPEKGTGRTKRCVFRFGKVGPEPSARPASSAPPANGAATTRNGPPTVPPECDPLRGGAKPCDAADRADHADHCGPTTAEASGVANKDASDLGEGEGEWTA